MQFKAWANYHNPKVQDEAASGDEKAASEFLKVLAEIIREGVILLIKCLTWMRQVYFRSVCLTAHTSQRRRSQQGEANFTSWEKCSWRL